MSSLDVNSLRTPEICFRHPGRSGLLPGVDALLKLLRRDASLTPTQMAALLGREEAEIRSSLKQLTDSGVLLGFRAVLNEDKLGTELVRAVIEVRITPERGGGFDKLAERIAKYDEVRSCHLMSGGYDLLVEVEGSSLREVASFVSEKLSTLQGVLSTATHFVLRPYKEQGVLMKRETADERLAVAP
jgi:DNA-binding Lrp family transcriptional regulator